MFFKNAFLTVYGTALLLCVAGLSYATTIDVLMYNDDPGKIFDQKIYNHETGSLIDGGALVQIVWAGNDGEIDSVTDTFMPSDDDMILFDSTGTTIGNINMGDGYGAGDQDGHFIVWLSSIRIEDYGTTSGLSDICMYIRFFSTYDPLATYESNQKVLWGESALFSFENADLLTGLLELDVAPQQSLSTTHSIVKTSPIPEPSSIMLLLLAVVGFMKKIYTKA